MPMPRERESAGLIRRAWLGLAVVLAAGAVVGACTTSTPSPAGTGIATPSPQASTPAGSTEAVGGSSTVARSPQTIGAGGGTVTSLDGRVQLTIPEGALTSNVTIRVEPGAVDSLPAGVRRRGEVTQVWRFEPDGTRFEKPVRVSLRLPGTPAAGDGGELPIRLLASRSGGTIELLEEQDQFTDLATGEVTVTASMRHFSEVWDNLFREFQLRVNYSGVPTQWEFGRPFIAEVVVTQAGNSPIGAQPVTFISDGKGAVGGTGAGNIGALVPNKEQRLRGAQQHTCRGAGSGEWTGVVNFTLLREAGTDDPEGVPLRSTYFTSRARRAIECIGPAPPPQPSSAVSLPGKYPTVVPRPFATALAGVEYVPRVVSLRSELRTPVTTYSVEVRDPVADFPLPPEAFADWRIAPGGGIAYVLPIRYFWTMVSGTEKCGTPRIEWEQEGASVRWSHNSAAPDSCPHPGTDHDVQVQLTVVKAESPRLVCILRGSETRVYGPEVCSEVPIDEAGVPLRPR